MKLINESGFPGDDQSRQRGNSTYDATAITRNASSISAPIKGATNAPPTAGQPQ